MQRTKSFRLKMTSCYGQSSKEDKRTPSGPYDYNYHIGAAQITLLYFRKF